MFYKDLLLNLQFFADGDGGEGAEASSEGSDTEGMEGVAQAAGEEAAEGTQTETKAERTFTQAEVEAMIKERTKKATKELGSLRKLSASIARAYKIADANDVKGILAAFEDDESRLKEEAYNRGISVEQLKYQNKLDSLAAQEQEEQKEQEEEAQKEKLRQEYQVQIADVRNKYGKAFDLAKEMKNPEFESRFRRGYSIMDCFELAHKNELDALRVKIAGDNARKDTVSKIQKGQIPLPAGAGGGMTGNGASAYNINSLSDTDIDKILADAKNGIQPKFVR